MLSLSSIFDTINMIDKQHLDIRTITMGISLLDCVSEDPKRCCDKIYDKICRRAEKLVQTGRDIESEFGIPSSTSASPSPPWRWWRAAATRRITFPSP